MSAVAQTMAQEKGAGSAYGATRPASSRQARTGREDTQTGSCLVFRLRLPVRKIAGTQCIANRKNIGWKDGAGRLPLAARTH